MTIRNSLAAAASALMLSAPAASFAQSNPSAPVEAQLTISNARLHVSFVDPHACVGLGLYYSSPLVSLLLTDYTCEDRPLGISYKISEQKIEAHRITGSAARFDQSVPVTGIFLNRAGGPPYTPTQPFSYYADCVTKGLNGTKYGSYLEAVSCIAPTGEYTQIKNGHEEQKLDISRFSPQKLPDAGECVRVVYEDHRVTTVPCPRP